jgi:hypothetical protein
VLRIDFSQARFKSSGNFAMFAAISSRLILRQQLRSCSPGRATRATAITNEHRMNQLGRQNLI